MNTRTEPVLSAGVVIGLVEAVLVLLPTIGVSITGEQHTAIIGVCTALAAVVVAILGALHARGRVTPNADVVEHVVSGSVSDRVIAGEASELPTGTYIREAGSLDAEQIDPVDMVAAMRYPDRKPTHRAETDGE